MEGTAAGIARTQVHAERIELRPAEGPVADPRTEDIVEDARIGGKLGRAKRGEIPGAGGDGDDCPDHGGRDQQG